MCHLCCIETPERDLQVEGWKSWVIVSYIFWLIMLISTHQKYEKARCMFNDSNWVLLSFIIVDCKFSQVYFTYNMQQQKQEPNMLSFPQIIGLMNNLISHQYIRPDKLNQKAMGCEFVLLSVSF